MRVCLFLGLLLLAACRPVPENQRLLPADTFDVYVDGNVVHLVGGSESGVSYRRSEDDGASWSEAKKIDSVKPRAGSDVQVAGMGTRVVAVWSASGTEAASPSTVKSFMPRCGPAERRKSASTT